MEMGLMSFVKKLLQVKRTLRFCYTVIIMAKIQTPESIKSYLGFRTQIYIHCYWGCRMAQSFQKIPAYLLIKQETAFSHNLETTSLTNLHN